MTEFEEWVMTSHFALATKNTKDQLEQAFTAGIETGIKIERKVDEIRKRKEKTIDEKLDIIIVNTTKKPRKPRVESQMSKEGEQMLALFNRYFGKKQGMSALNRKTILARIKDGVTVDQVEDWFKHVVTEKWWIEKPNLHKISTLLSEKLIENLENIGHVFSDDKEDEMITAEDLM